MDLKIQRVSYDENIVLRNLMEFYEYEMNEYEEDGDVNDYGLFGYKYLDHYWTEDNQFMGIFS